MSLKKFDIDFIENEKNLCSEVVNWYDFCEKRKEKILFKTRRKTIKEKPKFRIEKKTVIDA